MNMAHRWFTAGRAGNITLAGDAFGETLTFKAGIHEGLAAYRRSRAALGVLFSVNDKIVKRPVRRATHTGSYGPIKVEGKRAAVRDYAVWRVEDGNSAEISAIHGPLVPLKQIGYRREGVLAAPPGRAGGGPGAAAGP